MVLEPEAETGLVVPGDPVVMMVEERLVLGKPFRVVGVVDAKLQLDAVPGAGAERKGAAGTKDGKPWKLLGNSFHLLIIAPELR